MDIDVQSLPNYIPRRFQLPAASSIDIKDINQEARKENLGVNVRFLGWEHGWAGWVGARPEEGIAPIAWPCALLRATWARTGGNAGGLVPGKGGTLCTCLSRR